MSRKQSPRLAALSGYLEAVEYALAILRNKKAKPRDRILAALVVATAAERADD